MVAVDLSLGAAARAAASVFLVALAAVLLARGADQRAARVFAYLLLLLAVRDFPRALAGVLGGGYLLSAWGWGVAYVAMAVPFLMAYFAFVFPRPRGWVGRSRWGPWAMLALVLVVEAAYLWDHALYLSGPRLPVEAGAVVLEDVPPRAGGVLALLYYGHYLVGAAVAWVFARDFARAERSQRGSLLLVSLAFALLPIYTGVRVALYDLAGLETLRDPGLGAYLATRAYYITAYLGLPFCALLVAELVRAARRAPEPGTRTQARRGLAVLALAPGAAALVSALYFAAPVLRANLAGFFPGLFTLALPVLVTYALLRYRVFGLDLRVKTSLRQGTVVGAFVGVFVVVSEGSRSLLGDVVAPYAGLGAAAVLLFVAFAQVQRLAEGVAEAALPGVAATPEYLRRHRLEVYRAALEAAVEPGAPLGPRQAEAMASLRSQLGITEQDHAFVDLAVRASSHAPRAPLPEPGELMLGRYRVLHRLGAGAHGTTFLAEEAGGRRVVVKALRPDLADEAVLREASALRGVRHPNVVALEDVVEAGGQACLVMEHVERGSLAERLARGPLGREEFGPVALGLLDGLAAVHAAGIVHRDVKPSNVLLTADGQAKLADFGVAHLPGSETTMGGRDAASAVGTIRYMSPEQARGRKVTERGDVFSAAATLYEAWTGKPYLAPGPGESAVELQMRAASARPFRAPLPGASKTLRAWFARALHPDPSRRFPSARAAREALVQALG